MAQISAKPQRKEAPDMLQLSLAELNILDWIAAHCHTAWLDVLMPLISRLGSGGVVWIVLSLAILLFSKKEKATGAQVILALLLNLVLCNLLLKNLVGRIRPCDLNPLVEMLVARPQDPSFPSGHTASSFAAATVLLRRRWKGRWAALALAILMGLSRLYLYVHFPTDVLAGALLGIFCGMVSTCVWQKWLASGWQNTIKR
jgi:undecaprenyl-diphosphatase